MIPAFHPDAAAELAAAVKGGIKFGTTVGFKLRAETFRIVKLLCQSPNIGEPLIEQYRKFPLTGYPFSIVYRVDGNQLSIVAFAHKRRRPGYWISRK